MAYTEKMDALDLVIKTLKEHEKKLDELTSRMESILGSRGNNEGNHKWFPGRPSELEEWR